MLDHEVANGLLLQGQILVMTLRKVSEEKLMMELLKDCHWSLDPLAYQMQALV